MEIIHAQPGIRDDRLFGKTKPLKTVLFEDLADDGLISCNYAGSEKLCFFSEQGEKLYHELASGQEEAAKILQA